LQKLQNGEELNLVYCSTSTWNISRSFCRTSCTHTHTHTHTHTRARARAHTYARKIHETLALMSVLQQGHKLEAKKRIIVDYFFSYSIVSGQFLIIYNLWSYAKTIRAYTCDLSNDSDTIIVSVRCSPWWNKQQSIRTLTIMDHDMA